MMDADSSLPGPSSQNANPGRTIFTHLHSLLASQSSLTAALPYLHPYAPTSYKGKAKAHTINPQDQLDVLLQMKRGIDEARTVLEGVSGDEQRVKFLRAMKDVATHQQALLPTTTSLASLHPSSSFFPSRISLLSPIELLQSLAETIGIQAYLEESQFGLLKTSLTLAGTCFVVDLDLETDAVAGNEEDDEMDVDSRDPRDTRSERAGEREGKGRVRLSKISANHVRGDVTGKSEWVAKVIKDKMEAYLDIWNAGAKGWEGMVELEEKVRGLESELRDLKELDLIMERAGVEDTTGVDWFMELEDIARKLDGLFTSENKVFSPTTQHIFPCFSLLPPSFGASRPTFAFRPSRQGEAVSTPPGLSDDIEERWLNGHWVLEYARSSDLDDGLVVRRTWLSEESDEKETSWDGLIRVEHLLYRQTIAANPNTAPAMTFPYTSDFVHHPKGSLEQRWAMAEPGPEAFVIGRIGIPKSFAGFEKIVELLKTQAILNTLFTEVFRGSALDTTTEDENDVGDEDILSGPSAVPVTATLQHRSLRLVFPVVLDSENEPSVISVITTPSAISPFVDVQWNAPGSMSEDVRTEIDKQLAAVSNDLTTSVKVVQNIINGAVSTRRMA